MRSLGDSLNKVLQRDLQRFGESGHISEGDISLAPLDTTYVATVESRSVAERLLADTSRASQLSKPQAKLAKRRGS